MIAYLLDVGSTSVKYACCDSKGRERYKEGSIPFPPPLERPHPFFEVDSEQILAIIRTILAEVSCGDQIWISVQMHGYLLCDRSGRPLTPYISWRDQRSLLMEKENRYPFELPKSRGVGKKPNLPLAGLHAMKEHMPDIMEKAYEFCTLGSYLSKELTGRNCSHITDLAPTGMYDAQTGIQCEAPFGMRYPEVCGICEPVGKYRGAEVFAPVGDHQASVAGSGLQKDQYLLNMGTAAQLCTLSDQPVYGGYESRPYFGGLTLCTVTGLIGGRSFGQLEAEKNVGPLVESYGGALKLLPERASIRAVGGVCRYHRTLVEEALNQIGFPWKISDEADALNGLIWLMNRKDG